MAKNKKIHSFAFASALGAGTPTKTATRKDGTTVTLHALPVLPASPFRTMDSRSNIEFSYVAAQLIEDYNKQGRRHPLDIEHNTERGGDTRARGWSVEMTTAELEPDAGLEPGVLYCWYELTPLGMQEHQDQLYGYTSAVADGFWIDADHVQFTHIKSNARTNNPATKVPFSLTAVHETDADAPGEAGYTPENASSEGDDPAMLKAILEALGLTTEVDEATAVAHAAALTEKAAKAELAARIDAADVTEGFTGSFVAATRVDAVQTELTAARTELTTLTTQLAAAQGEVTTLTEQLAAAQATQTTMQLTAALDEMTRAKKVTPGQREAALELLTVSRTAFEKFVAGLNPVHNNDEQSVDPKAAQLNLTAEELADAKAAGISPEQFAESRDRVRKQLSS